MSSRDISKTSVFNALLICCDNLLTEHLSSQGTRASKCRFSFISRCSFFGMECCIEFYKLYGHIVTVISAVYKIFRFQQTQGAENPRRCRIRHSPCRLLQNNGVLKSVSTHRVGIGQTSPICSKNKDTELLTTSRRVVFEPLAASVFSLDSE